MSASPNAGIGRIRTEAINIDELLATGHFPECGGLALFTGTVRNCHEGKSVLSLKYTAYTPLAEKMIRNIEEEIAQLYGIPYVRAVHRIGHLQIGEAAICVVARAMHRREAFAACEAAVERIKHQVPIWKEEFYADGSSAFVEGCCIRTDNPAAGNTRDPAPAHTHHHDDSHHPGCGHDQREISS